jgi:cyclopropane-fatty-acyl-phospholipid synthase
MSRDGPMTRADGEVLPRATTGLPPDHRLLLRARRVTQLAFGSAAERTCSFRYWNGFAEPGGRAGPNPPTIVIRHPGALRAAFFPPSELALCEAFVREDLDVEGDLETVVHFIRDRARYLSAGRLARLASMAARLPPTNGAAADPRSVRRRWIAARRHTRKRDAAAIRHHYDVGNEFYRLWLDRQSVYSSAYFPPGVDDLDVAQEEKLDRICRKLRLGPGERMLDIGCGWGALIRYAARHYGVEATGITLSPSQEAMATRRIVEDGLGEHCRVEIRDYRDLPGRTVFDKVSSVGMFEHVGRAKLREYFAAAFQALRPGGLLLNSGIIELEDARPASLRARVGRGLRGQGRFLQRYIFPDGELLPLAEVVRAAEEEGFETRDVENLREHYMQTVRHWLRRLQAREREAVALAGEARYRAWRLYLAASADAFARASIGMVELLLSKPRADGTSEAPPTRDEIYGVRTTAGRMGRPNRAWPRASG